MKKICKLMVGVGLLVFLGGSGSLVQAAEPVEVGDVAPDFSLPGSDGKTYKMSELKGKTAVVIAWFPKAFTGG